MMSSKKYAPDSDESAILTNAARWLADDFEAMHPGMAKIKTEQHPEGGLVMVFRPRSRNRNAKAYKGAIDFRSG